MVAAATPQALKIRVYPKQEAFIKEDAYAVAFTGGRGSGKSKAGAYRLIVKSKPNSTYAIVAPSYQMMDRATLPKFRGVAEDMGLWTANSYREVKKTVELENGAKYLLVSADNPESSRGPDLSGCWFDEMQESHEDAYINLLPALREHGKRGWIQSTFTPGSPDHWTSKRFIKSCSLPKYRRIPTDFGDIVVKYSANASGDICFFRASTRENTFQEESIYRGLLADFAASPMRIRRELEGECIYMEGAEWLPEYFDNIGFDTWPTSRRMDDPIRILALDPSRGKSDKQGDYSAFVKVAFTNGQFFVDADMRNDRGDIEIAQTAFQICKEFNPHYFLIESESSQNDHLVRDIQAIGDAERIPIAITVCDSRLFSLYGTNKLDKKSRIRTLAAYISHRWFRFKNNSPGAKILLEQLQAFPLAEHDDGPDALAYIIGLLQKVQRGEVLPPRVVGYNSMGNAV